MAIPKIEKQDIINALKYIDENGVSSKHQGTKYELVKKYPPKYVVAVAGHIANGAGISTDGFSAVEAKSHLEGKGFNIETKQQKKFGLSSKNLIFRGAPGTGKSYLAKEIAADIISNGYFEDYTLLTDEQKKQVEFVQFHPSYDYSDFVEGLRPKVNDDGTMGFGLQNGIFKKFVARARQNYEDSQKPRETIEKEIVVQESVAEFFSNIELGVNSFKTVSGNEFTITSVDDKHINISIPGNTTVNKITLNSDDIWKMLESGQSFDKAKDITPFLGKPKYTQQSYSYCHAIYKAIIGRKSAALKAVAKQEELKKYIFKGDVYETAQD